jgi:crotonobetainyl-CoA:carnitine CoA-transferase CaiB-like acyl-CoA transferase
MTPHGVYPSAGDDAWIAVSCRDDDDWRALAGVLHRPDVGDLTVERRRDRRAELDTMIAAWTVRHSPAEAQAMLIAAGVPAHAVQNSGECATDVQLAHQGHFVTLDHPEHGAIVVEGSRTTLSDTPAVVDGIPPLLGQDTVSVLTDVLGYDDERLATLFAAGAIN